MRLTDFDYHLPPELIAQEPAHRRDASRLMTLDRSAGAFGESVFSEIPRLFSPGDLLVLNDTRVIPARLLGKKDSGGKVELFLVRRTPGAGELWHCLVKASKPPRPGTTVLFPGGMTARIEGRGEGDSWLAAFAPSDRFSEWLERFGAVPLPPYIRRKPEESDRERYQTVFARSEGAVAAPTAGLHFTPELLDALRLRGVTVANLTLHVGLGTFLPVRSEELSDHRMHREQYCIPAETAELIRKTKQQGGRIVALGTTTTRALEHAAREGTGVRGGEGEADIFITPGYRFKVVDALITNFHLTRSTLLMLVAAFAGRELLFDAYREAVSRGFRFYSYGDAMFIY